MKSCLRMETDFSYGKTNIKDVYFDAPYKIMSPFHQGEYTEIMQMCASAGMLSGDTFNLELQIGRRSQVKYTSQSYEKIFASKGEQTRKRTKICVEEQAKLCYMPHPMIPFAGSDFYAENEVRIHPKSQLIYCDIFNCGRVAMGEKFKMKRYCSKTRIYVGDVLALADHTLLQPDLFDYQSLGMWGEYTHNGLLYLYTGTPESSDQDEKWVSCIRDMIPDAIEAGCTRNQVGITLRALGKSGESIYGFFEKIATLCKRKHETLST